MKELGLNRLNDWSIQFNSAAVNEQLWLIKPYISLQPIRLPDGLPEGDEKMADFKLLSNGKLIDTSKRTPKHVQVSLPVLFIIEDHFFCLTVT